MSADPTPAAWLESRFDRAARLRAAREHILRSLAVTRDPYRRADLSRHLDTVTTTLSRLGAPE